MPRTSQELQCGERIEKYTDLTAMSASNAPPYAKRTLRVIQSESDDGSTEYKRQVHKLSTSRLHTLATQMSYRLDEGYGRCTYHVGVEDDGCHSVLDYSAVSESAWVLESIARSLNAIVLERKMIQNEIEMGEDGNLKLVDNINDVLVVEEPPVLGRGSDGFNGEDEKEEKSCGEDEEVRKKKTLAKLSATDEAYTRCELTIQRVETHLLDPSPLSLSSLSRGSSFAEGFNGAEATTLNNLERLKLHSSPSSTSCRKEESKFSGESVTNKELNDTHHIVNSVEETLTTRNIRVAVVGNVDAGKSTLIGTLTTSFLDDGRGSSRTSIMKHRHEIESGRTSTYSSHLLGFRHSGEPIAGRDKIRANKMKSEDEMLVVEEPPVLGRGSDGFNGEDEKEEKSCGEDEEVRKKKTLAKLSATDEAYTRCELTIQRVETHLLDPSPLSLSSLSRGSSFAEGFNGAEATTLNNLERLKLHSSPSSTSCRKEESKFSGESVTNKELNDTHHIVNSVEETLTTRNIRVAVVGNVDAGKSTLIGTLTTSFLDDGRGSSRTSIMKHRHEIESGRTSTYSSHLLGFRHSGEPIAGRDKIRANKMKSEDEIARESYRIVTLMDLAGHEKYLKTTIHGVSSGFADYSIVLVNSRHPPTHMTQHHINLCCSFGIPIIVVFTKIDGCPEHALSTSKNELAKMLKSPEVGRRPFAIKTEQDIVTSMGKLHTLAPTIDISCVTGEGLNLLRKMLFSLPKRRRHEKKVDRPFEFLVEDIFHNVPGVGSVVSGFVNAGELTVGSHCNVYVGPTNDGTFLKTVAKSAHVARINTSHITAGQSACLAFSLNKELRKKLRRGMVVLQETPTATQEFDAEICVLKGEGTTIRRSYQAYVHILNVRQSAFARDIEIVNNNALGLPPNHNAKEDAEGVVLRPGSRAKVRFEFAQRPEYIRPGMRMLFRDGRVRGVGIVTGIPQ